MLGVQAAAPGDSVYVVKVLYASSDSARRAVKPLALQRLYAMRAPGSPYGWQLSGAVARLTRDWERRAVGRIRFHYAPGQHPDTARAARAAAFVDSVATLFATRPPEWIDYYVTASPDEYQRAIGLDFFPLPSGRGTGTGGQALMNVVLAGDPALGEGYLHELVHVVLASTCCGNAVVGEGIATWLAGSKGRSAREMWGVLAAYQRAHPDVKLRALLDGDVGGAWGPAENDALYATDALIVEAIYRDAGVAGLRRLTRVPAGTDAILDALRRALPAEANDLDRWWRRAPAEYAASDDASALRPQRRTRARARARRGRARTG